MSVQGEIVRFRKKFFGGFNRDDVVAYISKLTSERNESLDAKEAAERELEELKGELGELREKLGMYEKLIDKLKARRAGEDSKPTAGVSESTDINLEHNDTERQKSVIIIKRKKYQ